MLKKALAILLSLAVATISTTAAAPISATATTYDQRQDGELNVNVGLDNFVILVARPVSSLDLFGAMAGLLTATDTRHADIQVSADSNANSAANSVGATSSSGGGSVIVADKQQQQQQQAIDNEQTQLLSLDQKDQESRNAKDKQSELIGEKAQMDQKKSDLQHHVDGSKTRVEEKVMAGSRGSLEEVVKTLRDMKEKELRDKEKLPANQEKIAAKPKFVESVEQPQTLRLVGDGVENCGPGRSRDSKGICQRDDYNRSAE